MNKIIDNIEYKLYEEDEDVFVELHYRDYELGLVKFITSPGIKGMLSWVVRANYAPYFGFSGDEIKRLASDYMRRNGYEIF